MLVDQYSGEYMEKGLTVMRGKNEYYCTNLECSLDIRGLDLSHNYYCGENAPYCIGCHTYQEDKLQAEEANKICGNYFTYLAYNLTRKTLIVDEAHKLIQSIQQLNALRIWQHKARYPHNITDRWRLKDWLKDRPDWPGVSPLIYKDLDSRRPAYLFNRTTDIYMNREEECIDMIPLDVSGAPPFFWPDGVERVVLMSATINHKDIEELGLADKKVAYVYHESPIPKNQRPILAPAFGGVNMSFKHAVTNLPQFVSLCQDILDYHKGEKGLVHASYRLAEEIRGTWTDKRLIYHDKFDKAYKYAKFRESPPEDGACLVASGMYEGVDLPYDYGRWQIIAKVPWPYLGEPAVKFKAEIDPEFYAWETVKTLMQACGRIVRSPTDYGITYIIDSTFKRLYNNNTYLFPKWFQASVRFLDSLEWEDATNNQTGAENVVENL